ncbi:MAG: hypothetical protein U0838_17220 [Chloroflexota bacterium]
MAGAAASAQALPIKVSTGEFPSGITSDRRTCSAPSTIEADYASRKGSGEGGGWPHRHDQRSRDRRAAKSGHRRVIRKNSRSSRSSWTR